MNDNRRDEIINFSLKIEDLAEKKHISYIEAVTLFCNDTGLEIEIAAKMISANLKTKIKIEAEELNLLERSKTKRLPL